MVLKENSDPEKGAAYRHGLRLEIARKRIELVRLEELARYVLLFVNSKKN
jgi:hypothetical protein